MVPSLTGPRWACERCGWLCVASKAYQSGCPHYGVQSALWREKALAVHRAERSAFVAVPGSGDQQGLAL